MEVISSEDYFSRVELEIDWEEDGSQKVSVRQADLLDKILATEASIFLLRRTAGFGGIYEIMVSIRRELIDKYEEEYEPYVEYNDFY